MVRTIIWHVQPNSLSDFYRATLSGVAAYAARVDSSDDPRRLESMIWLTVAHLVVGALTLAATVALALRCYQVLEARSDKGCRPDWRTSLIRLIDQSVALPGRCFVSNFNLVMFTDIHQNVPWISHHVTFTRARNTSAPRWFLATLAARGFQIC